jgi:hypothetical protein
MKKIFLILSLALIMSVSGVFASDVEKKQDWTGAVVLLASDALLITASLMAVVQQNTLASDYETLREAIDFNTEAEYYRLLYEREKVKSAEDIALIACSAAGAALVFTALDWFLLRGVFPPGVKAVFNPGSGSVLAVISLEY